MKTTSFGIITVKHTDDGPILRVKGAGQGTVEISLTADEFLMLLVELHNGLTDSRKAELKERIAYNLQKEQRR